MRSSPPSQETSALAERSGQRRQAALSALFTCQAPGLECRMRPNARVMSAMAIIVVMGAAQMEAVWKRPPLERSHCGAAAGVQGVGAAFQGSSRSDKV